EIACLIDFHRDVDAVIAHLPALDDVRARAAPVGASDESSVPGLVERYGVTHMQCTPSLASVLVQSMDGRRALASLRQLLVGGEGVGAAVGGRLRELVTGPVVNMYGPTETTIWSTTCRLEGATGDVRIGRPIANTQVYVLDERQDPVPIGTPGELYIGGDGVAGGYLNRPELTDER